MKSPLIILLSTILLLAIQCRDPETGCLPPNPNSQQQNAYVHLHWNWIGNGYYNINQILIPHQLAPSSFWVTQLQFDEGIGYMGLQTDATGKSENAQARFSLWNANACQTGDWGSLCADFQGEGVGKTITIPLDIQMEHQYRLRVWKTGVDAWGNWWSCFVKDMTSNEEYYLGRIRIPQGKTLASGLSFAEYFGGSFDEIRCVPKSIVSYCPPTANADDSDGSYQYWGYFNYSSIGDGTNASLESTTIGNVVGVKKVTMGGE